MLAATLLPLLPLPAPPLPLLVTPLSYCHSPMLKPCIPAGPPDLEHCRPAQPSAAGPPELECCRPAQRPARQPEPERRRPAQRAVAGPLVLVERGLERRRPA